MIKIYMANLLSMLTCPINIFKNIGTCSIFFILDLIALIIWIYVFINTFIIIYIPIKIILLGWCSILYTVFGSSYKKMFGKCLDISVYDVCPKKEAVSNFIENIYYYSIGGKLLYREKRDIRKCYCLPFIVTIFSPLRKRRLLFDL